MKYCPNCGSSVPETAHHCPNCGKPLPIKRSSPARYYLAGLILLVILGLLLGNYLQKRLPSSSAGNSLHQPGGTSSQARAGEDPTAKNVPTKTQVPPTAPPTATGTSTPPVPSDHPIGKIVFTCQLFKDNSRNQICIMNADGTGYRRLTTDDGANHRYAFLAPDGQSLVFSSDQTGGDEIYEMDLNGFQTRLTSMGRLYAPEISPDGRQIVFTNSGGTFSTIWIMDRDGGNPHLLYGRDGVEVIDPTWSPDGKRILFALGVGDDKRLYTINVDGTDSRLVTDQFDTRGRSDWSPDGRTIAGYSGDEWQRKVYLMNSDGSGLFPFLAEGNVLAPSFSSDGGWLAFTGYLDRWGDSNGCEIYIVKLEGGEPQRLTDNDYCDWQPRWGP